MSKKDKNKFRKRIKAELLREMMQNQPQGAKQILQSKSVVSQSIQTAQNIPQPSQIPQVQTRETVTEVSNEPINYIKKDLKKSAIIIGSLIILIVALSIVDTKTNILVKAGNQIFRVLHIGQ